MVRGFWSQLVDSQTTGRPAVTAGTLLEAPEDRQPYTAATLLRDAGRRLGGVFQSGLDHGRGGCRCFGCCNGHGDDRSWRREGGRCAVQCCIRERR